MASESDAEQSLSGNDEDEFAMEGQADYEDAAELGLDLTPPEFYDPAADEKDEKWMAKHRRGHMSDAVLSCPLCFTTLCIDCQQHARYENQFRAMFVMNCKVLTKDVVRLPTKPARQKKRRRQQQGQQLNEVPPAVLGEQQQQQLQGVATPTLQAAGQMQPLQEQQQPQQQGQDAKGMGQTDAEDGGEVLHPVECASCGTEVALRDEDGVYHFINVFASNA
ncbi:hypothetical protein N2152v2_004284 [Parachlorella kessleri]